MCWQGYRAAVEKLYFGKRNIITFLYTVKVVAIEFL